MENELIVWENAQTQVKPTVMVAGFNQWANAGDVSSGIPEYLIKKLQAQKLGHIRKGNFYIFQLPGNHYLFRPEVKYVDGYEAYYQEETINDFYIAEIEGKSLAIFIGTEPIMNEDTYVNTLIDGALKLGVKRIIISEGVGGEIPFEKERNVSCIYTPRHMKKELSNYAFTFSNYDKNATIGMVVNHHCQNSGIECVKMSVFTPSYEIPVTYSDDKRAMYDILRRIRHMAGINLDLSDLERESKMQISEFSDAVKRFSLDNPELEPGINTYLDQIRINFRGLNFNEPINIPDAFLKEFPDHSS
jgi:predicted ATP-grasp superfamily ATP-dependent carboligase